ncbi:hypothetical protein DMA11_20765 [Marinilabiliaceae bacterium JC017]|nr:hypothetical protein DMA11_20765 [Marinilabiliaceae bacterium JC017]
MKKTIEARHNANQQVLATLKNNDGKYAEVPIMISTVSELENLVNKTNSLFIRSESIPSKTAGNKNVAREDLVAITLKVSNVVKVYAFITRNENLSNFLICSESELSNRMRHQALLDYASHLSEYIKPIATNMIDYGLTATLIEELDTEITDFRTLITEPRKLINERKTTNELIEEQIDDIYTLLVNKLDPLMELFVNDKEFYLAYKAARMIVDPATRSKKEEVK